MTHRERTEITQAETPTPTDDDEAWYPLIWETAEEFVVRRNRSGLCRKIHLSARTFPGGADATDGEIRPHCYDRSRRRVGYQYKDTSVYPVGYLEVCDICTESFRRYHQTGVPQSGGSRGPDHRRNGAKTQQEWLESIGITIDDAD